MRLLVFTLQISLNDSMNKSCFKNVVWWLQYEIRHKDPLEILLIFETIWTN